MAGGIDSFSFTTSEEQFGSVAAKLDSDIVDLVATMDPNSTGDMVKFQVLFNKYMLIEGLRSSISKTLKDTIQSIIQKI